MNILGLNISHSNSSAALVSNGIIKNCFEEERFSRIKNFSGFPEKSIISILDQNSFKLDDIDFFTVNKSINYNILKKFLFYIKRPSKYLTHIKLLNNMLLNNNLKDELEKINFDIDSNKVIQVPHHISHISSSYFLSGFEDSFGLTVDGSGDFSTSESYLINKGKIQTIEKNYFPHSLGIFYQTFTQFLGFRKYGDEYKVMALSSFGNPTYENKIKEIVFLNNNNSIKLNLKYFKHQYIGFSPYNITGYPIFDNFYSEDLSPYLKIKPRYKNDEITQVHYDLACSVQKVFEDIIIKKINYLKKVTKLTRACFSGGCFFNSKMAGKIKERTNLEDIYIGSNPGDAGGSVGSAIYISNKLLKKKNFFEQDKISYGIKYDEAIEKKILTKFQNLIITKKFEDINDIIDFTSDLLKMNKIVAWFQSGSEWGPRALGFRSIIANPTKKSVIQEINLSLKKRESFRPFAPSICDDDYNKYFEKNFSCNYMNYVVKVKDEIKNKIPAVVHVDGSSRAHTVREKDNQIFYKLIKSFKNKTGICCILNTSLNINEPICETIEDALKTFLNSNLEYLIINKNLITKK